MTETLSVDSRSAAPTIVGDDVTSRLDGDRGVTALDDERLARIHRDLHMTRVIDARLAALAAAGRLPVHVPTGGKEAAVVGATAALGEHDWVFPTVHDLGAFVARDVPMAHILGNAFGNAEDPAKGRQMPGHRTARAQRIASAGSLVGTHLSHATGFAWAARIAGDPIAVLCFAERDAVPAADFHTALNFAAVVEAPVVFVVKNARRAGRASQVASRGIAYGIAGVRADGDDVLAVHEVVAEALEKAKKGGGPTLVEVVTGGADPIERFGAWLARENVLDGAGQRAAESAIEAELDEAFRRAERVGAPARETLFEDVYASSPPHLSEQRADLERRRR